MSLALRMAAAMIGGVAGSDPYWSSTKLLLHGDGANNGTTFADSTGLNTLTAENGAVTSTAQKKFGTASMLFNGINAAATFPATTNMEFGAGDFTIEGWFYSTGYDAAVIDVIMADWPATTGQGTWGWYISTANSVKFKYNANVTVSWTTTPPTNAWYHMAVVRSGNTLSLYINGTKIASDIAFNVTLASGSARVWHVGCDTANIYGFTGYIDDLRVTKGVARYTANFTPDAVAFPDN